MAQGVEFVCIAFSVLAGAVFNLGYDEIFFLIS